MPAKVPMRHGIDRRAHQIIEQDTSPEDDKLMTTLECANYLGVSEQFLTIARSKGYGPPWQRISPTVIRYSKIQLRTWLAERTYLHTHDYKRPKGKKAVA